MTPMARMSREEFERQAVLYAMGALTAEEARRFEAERARRGVEGERLELGVRKAIDRAGGSRGLVPQEREALTAVTARPVGSPSPGPWIALAIAFAVASAGAVAWALSERSRAEEAAARNAASAREVAVLRSTVERSQAALARTPPVGDVVSLLAAPDLVIVPLAGSSGASGRILAVEGQGALFVAQGLPSLAAGGTYQLWRRRGEVTEPSVPLGNAPRGCLVSRFSDESFLIGAETLIVTAEVDSAALVPREPAVHEGRSPR
jgi:hypothetical protein